MGLSRFTILMLLAASVLPAQTVTYAEHIAPILNANCVSCHRPGQIGPFALLTYTDALRHAGTIGAVTQSRYMPPWKPERGWGVFSDERRLTNDQVSLIQQWVAAGAPQGDLSKAPATPTFADDWALGKPDLILELPKPYPVAAEGNDEYRNFAIPTGITEDKWIKAIELKPSARAVVHHALFFSDVTGNARALDGKDGKPGFPGLGAVFTVQGASLSALTSNLGGWVPGTTPQPLPAGIAMPLPKGSDLLLQLHFHPNGIAQTEKTVIGIYFGPKPDRTPLQLQVPAAFGIQSAIDIPAGVSDYKVRGSFTLPVDIDGVTVQSHMHSLGKEAKLTATLPSGEVKILLWIRQWDFRWQGTYDYKDLVPLPAGTRLDGELSYDNSAANPFNPNSPPKRVRWGEQTTDEMGSMILTAVPKVQSNYNALLFAEVAYSIVAAPQVGNKPLFVSSGLVDAASAQPGAVAPGKIVVLYGQRMGPETLAQAQVADGKLTNILAGTQVLFDSVPAPLLYTSSGQLGAVVPYSVDGKKGTQVQVKVNGLLSDPVALPVVQAAPSIFSINYTGSGQGAILNEDGATVNSTAKPANKGSIIAIYATGEGQTSPAGVDGKLAASIFPAPVLKVQVRINGAPAEVFYAGTAPGSVAGLMQINAKIPADTPSGEIPVEIQVGDGKSQPGITVAIR